MLAHPLRSYLKSLPTPADRAGFAERCGTSLNYLRKAMSAGERFREALCIAIERESGRTVTCEQLRPDVDWAAIRGTAGADAANAPSRRLRA